ncbi:MAG: FkbM family methyltransferase [Pyrinomonadaceae bacterium]
MTLKKTIAVNLSRLFQNHTYTSRHGLAKGLRRRGGLAFLPSFVPRSTEMIKEEEFIASLDLSGETVYDIGADQGIYTLFFARKVGATGRVITFEPNPVSYSHVVTNVELNQFSNVEVRNVAIGDTPGKLTFAFPGKDPGRGTADELIREQILKEPGSRAVEVAVEALDGLIATDGLPPPTFAKIDVEGFELQVLRGMSDTLRNRRPKLFIEIHGADMKAKTANIRQVGAFLLDLGYKIQHVESRQVITIDNVEEAREGHIYCT